MSMDIAPAERSAVAPRRQTDKPKRIPPKIRKAVNLLETGECKTQRAAAQRIGVSDAYLCVQLKKPHVQAFIAQRRAENLARGTLRASARIAGLVDADSEHVALHASRLLLETSGDLKTGERGVNININNNIAAGYVIDLSAGLNPQSAADEAKPLKTLEHVSGESGDRGK